MLFFFPFQKSGENLGFQPLNFGGSDQNNPLVGEISPNSMGVKFVNFVAKFCRFDFEGISDEFCENRGILGHTLHTPTATTWSRHFWLRGRGIESIN